MNETVEEMNISKPHYSVINSVFNEVQSIKDNGKVASYIPQLATIDPNQFGVSFLSVEGEECGFGDFKTKFSIQSISKVFSLSLAYKIKGGDLWDRVGVEPSGTAFNSLVQLEADKGIPRNPLINGGALVICDILLSELEDPLSELLNFIHQLTETNHAIHYSDIVAKSEASIGYRNKALCYFMKSFDNIKNDPERVLDFYFKMCSIEMTCQELSRGFMFLANSNYKTKNNDVILNSMEMNRINAIMQTCGFYDESGEFSFKVGLPGKSGVGGGIVALHPEKYCISVWSPRLNEKGNSKKGMKFLEFFTTETQSSIF